MQIVKSIFSTSIVIFLLYLFNHSLGSLPPLGKILDPKHGFMANAETKENYNNKEINISDINKSKNIAIQKINGNVYIDDRLVPHIYADDSYSLYFLQGYITAKYRLWQMETQTRAAAGRLSEILGKDLLNYDREQRRIGMGYAAEISLESLKEDAELFNCVDAYTQGVNQFIESLNYENYPVEYKLIDYKPELWSPLKTMYLLKYMANTLTGFDDDLEYTNNLKLLGRKDFDLLFPNRPEGIVPIIPSEKAYDFSTKIEDTIFENPLSDYYAPSNDKTISNKEKNEVGSNNWVVGKEKTKNGFPILCNDPHLQLNLPSIWFEIQLHAPGLNVYGASLPGAPAVVIGFNENIAWGVTNAGRDVRDWYAIEFKDNTKSEYKYNDIWKPTNQRIETIKIKGEEDFIDTVIYTHYGPMVYQGAELMDTIKAKHKSKENLAMRWAAHDNSLDIKAFYLLNFAKNYSDYRNALQYFSCPAQNFVFGCTDGDIAITQQGVFAIKYPEQGRFVLNGNDPNNEWKTYIPFDQNPTIKNPQQHYLASANQHPTDSTYPYYYTSFDFEYFRNVVINQEIKKMNEITSDDLRKLQTNNFNLLASYILDTLLNKLNYFEQIDKKKINRKDSPQITENDFVKSVYSELKSWNYYNEADVLAPTYFQIWWNNLYKMLWDEFESKEIAFRSPGKYETMLAIIQLPNDYFLFDNKNTKKKKETLEDIINQSFITTIQIADSIKNENEDLLKWYQHKSTDIMHIAQIPAFSKMDINNGGYRNIVNATSETHGGSWRMVVELSNPINAYGVYPGGQSGNPGSKYYDNFIDTWAAGENYKLNFFLSEEEAKKNASFKLTFN